MASSKRTELSRRDFLRLAELGAGVATIGLIPGGQAFLKSGTRVARAAAQRAGTLRVGWTKPISLDPALYADAPDISIGVALYDYLVMLDSASAVVPHLAKSWTISDDGLVYTFVLESRQVA